MSQKEKTNPNDTAAFLSLLGTEPTFRDWDDPNAGSTILDSVNEVINLENISPDAMSDVYIARGQGHLRLQDYTTAESDFKQALQQTSFELATKEKIAESYMYCTRKIIDLDIQTGIYLVNKFFEYSFEYSSQDAVSVDKKIIRFIGLGDTSLSSLRVYSCCWRLVFGWWSGHRLF